MGMKIKRIQTAAFIGHNELPDDISGLKNAIEQTARSLIPRGVVCIGIGGDTGFDALAAKVLLGLRDMEFPQVRLIRVLPFKGIDERWTQEQKRDFEKINSMANKVVWFAEECTGDEQYHARNRQMVDQAAHLVAYCTDTTADNPTASGYRYAVKKGLNTILLNGVI
jgi:uncharacterized phage-like protein YoqJ